MTGAEAMVDLPYNSPFVFGVLRPPYVMVSGRRVFWFDWAGDCGGIQGITNLCEREDGRNFLHSPEIK